MSLSSTGDPSMQVSEGTISGVAGDALMLRGGKGNRGVPSLRLDAEDVDDDGASVLRRGAHERVGPALIFGSSAEFLKGSQ